MPPIKKPMHENAVCFIVTVSNQFTYKSCCYTRLYYTTTESDSRETVLGQQRYNESYHLATGVLTPHVRLFRVQPSTPSSSRTTAA